MVVLTWDKKKKEAAVFHSKVKEVKHDKENKLQRKSICILQSGGKICFKN